MIKRVINTHPLLGGVTLNLSGCHFEYAGKTSRVYNLIFANATTTHITKLSGESASKTVYDKHTHKAYMVGQDYSDSPISFDAEIISETGEPLSREVRKEIERWLFCQPNYEKLYIDTVDDALCDTVEIIGGVQKRLYLSCRFVDAEKLEYNGGIVGYKVTVACDSRMSWQEPIKEVLDLNLPTQGSSAVVNIKVDTDINDYTYPKITITMGDLGGNLLIYNNSIDNVEKRFVRFANLEPNVEFTMDGRINYISNNQFQNFITHNFIRLWDGENKLTIIGNVKKIEFEWQNRRFI